MKATEKQIKYLQDLVKLYYTAYDDKKQEWKDNLIAKLGAENNLSKEDASKAIKIMKSDLDIQKEAWKMFDRGKCKASSYYAAHTDIYDTTDDETLIDIWATL